MNDKLRKIRSLLADQATLVVATVDGDGKPRCTPLFFIRGDDFRLYWFSARSSQHSRNFERTPQASVAVFRNTRKWQQIRGVQMDGLVSAVGNRVLRARLAREYAARFALGDLFAGTIRRSGLYCFTPNWVRYLDNSRGFGFKFEMRLPEQRMASRS